MPIASRAPVKISAKRRGQHHVAEDLPPAGAERLRRRTRACGDVAHAVARRDGRHRQRGQEQQRDLRGLADAEPDDQQHEIGELRQRPEELDEGRASASSAGT